MVAGCSAAPEERSNSNEQAFTGPVSILDPFWYDYPAVVRGQTLSGVFAVMPDGQCPDIPTLKWGKATLESAKAIGGFDWENSWGKGAWQTYYQSLYQAVLKINGGTKNPDGSYEFIYPDGVNFCVYYLESGNRVVDLQTGLLRDDAAMNRLYTAIQNHGGIYLHDAYSPTYVGQVCYQYSPGCIGSDCGCDVNGSQPKPPPPVLVSTVTGPANIDLNP
jgi:hypothetical protein